MEIKLFEIRDIGTFIPALAVNMDFPAEGQRYLLRRCGYPLDGSPNILLTHLSADGKVSNDPYSWGGRTWPIAHQYIIENWPKLKNGDVIDVEFILGESKNPKISEQWS